MKPTTKPACFAAGLVEELDRIKAKGDIRRIGVSGAHIDNVITTFGASLDVV